MHVSISTSVFQTVFNLAISGFRFVQLEISRASYFVPRLSRRTNAFRTEIVLSILLTSFEFFSGHQKITWTMPGVSAPVVEGDDITHPSLPMLVSVLGT